MIILMILGLVLMCASIFLIIKEQKDREKLELRLDEAFNSINIALETFDVQTTDFNKTVELIFREIEEKYQELFLLYGLIEEQKNSVGEMSKERIALLKSADGSKVSADASSEIENKLIEAKPEAKAEAPKPTLHKDFLFKNKNAEQIFKLSDEGMGVADIAKKLSIGAGEVQLLLNIRKA